MSPIGDTTGGLMKSLTTCLAEELNRIAGELDRAGSAGQSQYCASKDDTDILRAAAMRLARCEKELARVAEVIKAVQKCLAGGGINTAVSRLHNLQDSLTNAGITTETKGA